MPINNIPGVGPTNADIATAVAAPSAATIAAAVAAPSAATIATAVAAAVPTTAGITSIVQANAGSPYAGSWTYIGYMNPNGSATGSFTGLSSYKYLKVFVNGIGTNSAQGANLVIRFNSNSSGYAYFETVLGQPTNPYGSSESNSTALYPISISNVGSGSNIGTIEIKQSNSSTAPKIIDYKMNFFVSGSGTYNKEGTGIWTNTNAISSITFSLDTSALFSLQTGRAEGIYMWGGN